MIAIDASLDGLLDGVLDDGLVDEGQHLFRHSLGDRQKAGACAGGGDNGGAYSHNAQRIAALRRGEVVA